MKSFIEYIQEEGEGVVAQGTTTQSVAGLTGEPPVFPKRKRPVTNVARRKIPGVMDDTGSSN
jgi:hypothetical protein